MTDESRRAEILQLWPLLRVRDIERSLVFYRDRLGFTLVGEAESEGRVYWCRLERGAASVMLQKADAEIRDVTTPPGGGVILYFLCDDADAMFDELRDRGLELDPPAEAYYGMRQLFVPEPDGYVICFESRTERWAESAGVSPAGF